MKIHGYMKKIDLTDPLYFYGTDREMLINLGKNEPGISGVISEKLGLYKAQVIWAVRNEMARSVEDVLSRRTRCLLLDSRESVAIAPVVAELMAIELQKDTAWVNSQVQSFKEVAANYMLN